MFRYVGQAGGGPLMSNVRHRNPRSRAFATEPKASGAGSVRGKIEIEEAKLGGEKRDGKQKLDPDQATHLGARWTKDGHSRLPSVAEVRAGAGRPSFCGRLTAR
jgi:hypothetical protein